MPLLLTRTAAVFIAGVFAMPAAASVVPFTETFADGNANWGGGGLWQEYDPLQWVASGGPDGGAHVRNTQNFGSFSPGEFPLTMFRGQDNYGSSAGAFQGDWINSGITEFSFWVRHDAPVELTYFVRFTPVGSNSPSMNLEFSSATVQANTWTQLTVEISPDNPDFVVGGGPGTYENVFGNLGKIQIGAAVGELAGIDQDFHFDLANVAINVPAPGALALLAFGAIGRRRRRPHA